MLSEPVSSPVFIWLHLEPVGAGPFSPLTRGQDCLLINMDSAFSSTRYSVCCGGFDISASTLVPWLPPVLFVQQTFECLHVPGTW